MKISDGNLSGLKFVTDEADNCVDETWNNLDEGNWKQIDVPDGQVICGFAAETISNQ